MKKHVNDAETNTHLDQWRPGLKRQEFISYQVEDNVLRKRTTVRTYMDSGRYTDSLTSETICNAT